MWNEPFGATNAAKKAAAKPQPKPTAKKPVKKKAKAKPREPSTTALKKEIVALKEASKKQDILIARLSEIVTDIQMKTL